MSDPSDPQAWRDHVVGSLADIKAQLGRLASDRESEKETLIRVTAELHAEDRRHAEKLADHVRWNDEQHEVLHEKHNKIAGRTNFFMGVGITLQFIVTVAVAVIAMFMK